MEIQATDSNHNKNPKQRVQKSIEWNDNLNNYVLMYQGNLS